MTQRFKFEWRSGPRVVIGVCQGNGGPVATLGQIERQIHLAISGRPLGIYEPLTGHCCVYENFTADSNGPKTLVDLRDPDLKVSYA